MQKGKGAAAGTPGEDWLHLATYESLCQDIGTQQVHAAGGIIVGYVIGKTNSRKPALGDLLPGTMMWKRSPNSVEITPIECSFLLVDSERRATDMFKAYLAIGHKRLAKIYFTAESKNVNGHVVCYEKLTRYPVSSEDMSIPKAKWTWQLTTRQLFEAVDELLKLNYGRIVYGSPENSNYLFYGKGEDSDLFPPIRKGNNADIVKFISVLPLKKITDQVKKKQLTDIIDLFGKFGVRELDEEYSSFQSLVNERKSYNMPAILGHPFTLLSEKERVDIVEPLNEAVHGLNHPHSYETYMSQKLPELEKTWKQKVKKKGFASKSNTVDAYPDNYRGLLRFLRNYITHERDLALQRDVNYADLHSSVYRPFGAFLSWTYTYIHTV